MSAATRTIQEAPGMGRLFAIIATLLAATALFVALAYGLTANQGEAIAPAAGTAPVVAHDHGWSSTSPAAAPVLHDRGWSSTSGAAAPVLHDHGWAESSAASGPVVTGAPARSRYGQ